MQPASKGWRTQGLFVGLWGVAEVGFNFAGALREETWDVLIFDGGHDDAVLAVLPIGGCGHLVFGGELEGVDNPKDFSEVAPRGRGIGQGQLDLFVRPDDEHGSDGQGIVRVRVNHVIEVCDGAIRVCDHGEINESVLRLIDVTNPAMVFPNGIHADGDALDAPFVELLLEFGYGTQLGGAHWRVVLGVGE